MRPSIVIDNAAPSVYQGPALSYNHRLVKPDLTPSSARMAILKGNAPEGQSIVVMEVTNTMYFAPTDKLVAA